VLNTDGSVATSIITALNRSASHLAIGATADMTAGAALLLTTDGVSLPVTNASLWGVHSRKNNNINAVTNGWIDNEFDTQRRRRILATARTLWP
jgi:hypothetical protein